MKPSKTEELFILINEEVLKNTDVYDYLKSIEKKGPNNNSYNWKAVATIVCSILILIFLLIGFISLK